MHVYAFLHFWTGLLSFSCVLENGWGVQAFYIHGDDDSAAVGYRLLNDYADDEAPDQFTDADSTIRCVSLSLFLCLSSVSLSLCLADSTLSLCLADSTIRCVSVSLSLPKCVSDLHVYYM